MNTPLFAAAVAAASISLTSDHPRQASEAARALAQRSPSTTLRITGAKQRAGLPPASWTTAPQSGTAGAAASLPPGATKWISPVAAAAPAGSKAIQTPPGLYLARPYSGRVIVPAPIDPGSLIAPRDNAGFAARVTTPELRLEAAKAATK